MKEMKEMNEMNEMNDTVTRSFIAGTAAFLYKEVFNHLIYYLGITPFLYRAEAATLMVPLGAVNTISGSIMGLIIDWILLVWFALVTAYVFKTTGHDYAIVKGFFVGASSWLIVYGFFAHTGMLGLYKPNGMTSGLTSLFFDTTAGMVYAYTLVYLHKREELRY